MDVLEEVKNAIIDEIVACLKWESLKVGQGDQQSPSKRRQSASFD
jgi:hypothetical protein